MSFTADHIPILLKLSVPTGVARPFVTFGLDYVVNRNNRSFEVIERDPFPENIRADHPDRAELIARWESSAEANYLRNATLNSNAPERYAGILVGIGLDIAVSKIEIPVEFRFNIYPSSGTELQDRGEFPPRGTAETYDPNFTVTYNDIWRMQAFVLFGLDYVIF